MGIIGPFASTDNSQTSASLRPAPPAMANFGARRGPTQSHYLQDLNIIPSEHDQQQHEAAFDLTSDLSLYANTEFIDFDFEADMNGTGNNGGIGDNVAAVGANKGGQNNGNGGSRRDDINFTDTYPFTYGQPDQQHATATEPFSQGLASPTYTTAGPQFGTLTYASPTSQQSPTFSASHTPNPNADPAEEAARVAAEEDKRRRNTAASARFRVKKKQREQQLEKSAKELNDKVTQLESKVTQLSQENGWLRSLVVEKKGEEELAEKYQEFKRTSDDVEDGERSTKGSKKGVGTRAVKA